MNEEDETDESALYMAEMTVALADVMALMCQTFAAQNAPSALGLAHLLEKISDEPNLKVSPAFSHISQVFAQHLRGNMDMGLLSLERRDPSSSGRSELQRLIQRVKKPPRQTP